MGSSNLDYEYQRIKMMKAEYTLFDWYQYGRKVEESKFGNAFIFSEDAYIQEALLSGAIRENRFFIVDNYLNEYNFKFEMAEYVTTRDMMEHLERYFRRFLVNFYRYSFLIGKCRILPLKKLKKQIDGFKKDKENDDRVINCMKASAENKNEEVFEYIYKKYIEYGLDGYTKQREIASEAVNKGNYQLLEKIVNKLTNKDIKKMEKEDVEKIRNYISKNEKRNVLVFEKIAGSIHSKIPADVTRYIINRFIYAQI